jgi:hypothetical protein
VNIILRYALSVSALSIILKLAIFFGGYNFKWPDNYYLYAVFLFMLLGIFLGMRSRIIETNRKISLKNLIKDGCKIASLNAVFLAAFLFIYYKFIDIHYFQQKIQDSMALMDARGDSIEDMMRYYMNAKYFIFAANNVASFALFGYLVLGCIYAILSGILLRRNLSGV